MLSHAYHEAGHAIAAVARGRRVEWLSIEVRGRLGGLCYAVPADAPPVSERAFRQAQAALAEMGSVPSSTELLPTGADAEASVVESLAGPVAQMIGTRAAGHDWIRGADDMKYALEVLQFDTRQEAAATEFFALMGRTDALMRERWREVEAIAARLWLYGELNGAAIQEILDGTKT
jgi:hypothetical protein